MDKGQQHALLLNMLDAAYARGVNFFDMSELYPSQTGGGYSEYVFGEWMKQRKIPRDSIVVSTKVAGAGGNLEAIKTRYATLGRNFSKDEAVPARAELTKRQILDACEASLIRLGLDYIDLYETHWPSRYVPKFGETGARFLRRGTVHRPSHPRRDLFGRSTRRDRPLGRSTRRPPRPPPRTIHAASAAIASLDDPRGIRGDRPLGRSARHPPRPPRRTIRAAPLADPSRYNPALEHDFVPFEEQLEAMAELYKAGKIRSWGVSNETTFGVATFLAIAKIKGLPPPVSIQNDYSLCDRRFETELAEACSPLHGDMGLVAYGCLCGGTLAGKYSFGRKPTGEARHLNMPGFQRGRRVEFASRGVGSQTGWDPPRRRVRGVAATRGRSAPLGST